MVVEYGEWGRKGATLSDKSARREFGLTEDEILGAIDAGHLQYRVGSVHGNPWLRLLRREVEALVDNVYTDRDHRLRRATAELRRLDKELGQLKAQVVVVERQQADLIEKVPELRETARWRSRTQPLGNANHG